ncbi:hypothetical protein CBS101457_004302 [Exobasidium rhododendri]|nr:hypothetical protein CBS101457_004302 [Exobasidium rhododendri]
MANSPPPSSPVSLVFSSPNNFSSQSSAGVFTPTNKPTLRFARHYYDAYEDSDEEIENIDPRAGPSTPKNKYRSSAASSNLTPSKFVVKGTVTPSRAAPLFAQFTSLRRPALRRPIAEESSDEEEQEFLRETGRDPFSTTAPSSVAEAGGIACNYVTTSSQPQRATFLSRNSSHYQLPRMPIPTSNSIRHRSATEDLASHLLAIRTNSLAHLPWAASARGTFGGTSSGGVLGVSRSLGPGYGRTSVSHRAFHQTFRTESIEGSDLFTVPSISDTGGVAHPLCAEYAYSSRSLSNYQAQWLAVGDNEGSVHLVNTLDDCMASVDTDTKNKPHWSTCHGSVFELKWRFDDEMIATGSSDYMVKIWSPETGSLLRSFKGHRGSPRSIAWDPSGAGNILVSGGRDGGLHIFDLRVKDHSKDGDDWSPCLSLWEAHGLEEALRPLGGPRSRGATRGFSSQQPKGVTSITFLPGRGSKLLASAGCADAKVKLWDLRFLESESKAMDRRNATAAKRRRKGDEDVMLVDPIDQGIDVTKHSHGISSMVVGADKLFAACTDGRIYTIECADFLQTSTTSTGYPVPPLYHEAQRGNTLYARMALHDDDRTLALGCNTGVITLWDTHAASLALGEVMSDTVDHAGDAIVKGQSLNPIGAMARPAILGNGHSANFEVNCVSWAHGPQGPTLASVSDDYTIRTWHSNPREEGSYCDRY